MTRIKIESDMHVDIYKYYTDKDYEVNLDGIDIYIIAGDAGEEKHSRDFIIKTASKYPNCQIVEVAGNHMAYKDNMEMCYFRREELMESLSNYHFLENSSASIHGYKIIGCCLWTDMNNGDERISRYIGVSLNDYYYVKYGKEDRVLTPYRTREIHRLSKEFIKQKLESSEQPCIVVTHHLPFIDYDDRYNDKDLLFGYGSDMQTFIDNLEKKPIMWISGHTHRSRDFKKDGIRFVSNQHGYPSENLDYDKDGGYNKDFVIEI